MAETPRHNESRTMGEEILERAGEQPAHEEETPLTGASRASSPPRPPKPERASGETPDLPPGAR